jgi:2-oxoglutarate ferredoxin oxidoreductase subunit gamma
MSGRFEVRFGGIGGQGLQLCGRILATAAMLDGRFVAQSQSYEPTSRGGLSRSDVVLDGDPIDYPLVAELDALVLLHGLAVAPSLPLLKPDAVIVADLSVAPDGEGWHRLGLASAALELGNPRVTNIVALGALAALSPLCARETIEKAVAQEVPSRFRQLNLDALAKGYDLATEVASAA